MEAPWDSQINKFWVEMILLMDLESKGFSFDYQHCHCRCH
jgi:hypothetical protein